MSSADAMATSAGWTRPTWISLAVKSWRIGWLDGWLAAERVLPPGLLRGIAVAQMFEDTAPTPTRAIEIAEWIRAGLWALCLAEDTHHGKGHTEAHVHGAAQARGQGIKNSMTPADQAKALTGWSKNLGITIPPRAWCWWRVWLGTEHPAGILRNRVRALWDHAYVGMPDAVLDYHTPEGKLIGEAEGNVVRATAWSGDKDGHRFMGETVMRHGWDAVRGAGIALAPEAEARHASYLAEYGTEQPPLFA